MDEIYTHTVSHIYSSPILFIHIGSFGTRALEKMRKHEIAFVCVILKENKSSLKDIQENTTQS
jgi:hypothetical protein